MWDTPASTLESLANGFWSRAPHVDGKKKTVVYPLRWHIGDQVFVLPYLGRGMTRCVWAAGSSWVLKYDYRDGSSNSAELKLSQKYDWLPRTVPAKQNGRVLIQERGGAPLNETVTTWPKDQVARELASFLAYAKRLGRIADQAGLRIKDFLTNNVAKGLSADRPWLCIDVANWVEKGEPHWQALGVKDIQAGLRSSWGFEAYPGLSNACAEWVGGPGGSEEDCAAMLMPYVTGESGAAGLFPRVPSQPQGPGAAAGLLDRDCLAGLGVAARVAA
jgi:hypothetical protein